MTSKECTKCNRVKCLSDFYKHKEMRNGHIGQCKECVKLRVRSNYKKVGNKYDLTERGIFRVIYKTQKRNQKIRGHGDMPYTKDELIEWCKRNNFDSLFNEWVLSGNKTELKPSIDRIDSLKGYSLDNIKLTTWGKNRSSQYEDIRNGNGSSGKVCKPLLKLDSEMNIVCEYVSYNSAQRAIGYSVEYQIKNKVKCRNGFYWKYKNNN